MENFDLTTYSGRLAYAMHKAGKSNQSELARELTAMGGAKVTRQSIQHLVCTGKGSTHNAKLAIALGISTIWLERGRGDMMASQSDAARETLGKYGDNFSAARDSGRVPLISWVQAGQFCEAIDNFFPGDGEEWLPCPSPHSDKTFALRVVGESMTSPRPGDKSYPEGTVIFIDPEKPVFNGCKVVARVPSTNTVTFKKYVEDAGRIYLMPLNPSFDKIEITEEVHICGVLIGAYMPE